MESAISALVSHFKAFAGKDGSSASLSREEFCSLVTAQLPTFVKNSTEDIPQTSSLASLLAQRESIIYAGLMESAIETVVEVYLKFAGTKENLSLNAFQRMVKKQLGNIMTDTDSSGAIKEMRQGLEHDKGKSRPGKAHLPLPLTGQQKPPVLQPLSMTTPEPECTSCLENAMQLMIQTFHKYSGKEGDKFTLSRAELRELLTEELGHYLGNAQDKEAVDKVMADLDANNDGEVDFTEFIILVGALTVACNDFFDKDKK
ncbi:hypothetical protein COCON_G00129760 [Conger conger]|uniref:EF-hand domain-containing protein n=2 Tax=Conger conger TaxID=82655 RepID=A0A9Q1HXC8_CONCO|nr:hypothetical protein COCON_G00129760 [Conger conger]